MKTLVAKIVLATSVALGTLVTAGAAYAQPPRYHAAPEVYDTQGNPRYGFGPRVPAQPGDVISGNRQMALSRSVHSRSDAAGIQFGTF